MPKNIIYLYIALFLIILGSYLAGTLLVPFGKSLGASAFTIGLIYSFLHLVRIFVATPLGYIAEKKGITKVLFYSFFLYPFIAILYLFCTSILALLGVRLLHGLASAMMFPMAKAYISEHSPEGLEGKYMGRYTMIEYVAGGIGPISGGIIFDHFGMDYIYWILLSFGLISLALVYFLLSETMIETRNTRIIKAKPTSFEILHNRQLISISFIVIIIALLTPLYGASFTQYALRCGIKMKFIGFLMSAYYLAVALLQIPLGKKIDKWNKYKVINTSTLALIFTTLLFPFCNSLFSIGIIVLLVGMEASFLISASSAVSSIIGKKSGTGKTMGFLTSVNSIGLVTGYLLFGLIGEKLNLDTVYYIAAGLMFVSLLSFVIFWKRRISKVFQYITHSPINFKSKKRWK